MKRILLLLVIALVLAHGASASTFRITSVGGLTPFQSDMTNIYFNDGSGTRFGLHQDQTRAFSTLSHGNTHISTAWHNPHNVAFHGSSFNTAHRTIEPSGWHLQQGTIRTSSFGLNVHRSPWEHDRAVYSGSGFIGSPQGSVWPTAYRQPTPVHNPWGVQSNWQTAAPRTQSAYVRTVNMW